MARIIRRVWLLRDGPDRNHSPRSSGIQPIQILKAGFPSKSPLKKDTHCYWLKVSGRGYHLGGEGFRCEVVLSWHKHSENILGPLSRNANPAASDLDEKVSRSNCGFPKSLLKYQVRRWSHSHPEEDRIQQTGRSADIIDVHVKGIEQNRLCLVCGSFLNRAVASITAVGHPIDRIRIHKIPIKEPILTSAGACGILRQ